MTYEQWKLQYISILKNKIKSHENSIDYGLHELNKLAEELLEMGIFQEHARYWEDRDPLSAANESYNTWLEEYF